MMKLYRRIKPFRSVYFSSQYDYEMDLLLYAFVAIILVCISSKIATIFYKKKSKCPSPLKHVHHKLIMVEKGGMCMPNNDQVNLRYYGLINSEDSHEATQYRVHWICKQVTGRKVLDI